MPVLGLATGLIVLIVVVAIVVVAALVMLARAAGQRRAVARRERKHRIERERAAVDQQAASARAERAQAEAQLAHARQAEIEAKQRRERWSPNGDGVEGDDGDVDARTQGEGRREEDAQAAETTGEDPGALRQPR